MPEANPDQSPLADRRKGMRKAMVCGVSDGPGGPELVIRFNAEQWLVACLSHEAAARWRRLIGHTVFVDPSARPVRILQPTPGHDDD
jgi:hypothetical protein